jgi:hypothetical protein
VRARFAAAALLSLAAACAPRTGAAPAAPAPTAQAAYEAAVLDAAVYRPGDVRPLLPLAPDSAGRVRVTTLTDSLYTVGAAELAKDVWVTLVPEVRDACRRFSGDLAMRLRQLLGLRPDDEVRVFAVFDADTADVFRPAPDPSTRSTRPCAEHVSDAECGLTFPVDADSAHVRWIGEQALGSWKLPRGYPWTRLGYTYDWAPGASRYGASEYVVRRGAAVEIVEVVPYAAYCAAL